MKTLLSLVCLILLAAWSLAAQTAAAAKAGPPDARAQIEELVVANGILADEGVLDSYGHVTVRSARNPNHYFMARAIAAGSVTARDIVEYDLDSQPVERNAPQGFIERYIHGEIYKSRPDVMAIVHSHAAEVIPFTVSSVPLRPIAHMAAFLGAGVPVFEIRKAGGMTDMLIRTPALGRALAETLGDKPAALLRGHGDVVVAESLHVVVGRAYYMTSNAKEQQLAIQLGGKVTYLDPEEARKAAPQDGFERAWAYWRQKVVNKH